jgi:zinc transport system ATP-binding protein
MRGIVSDPVLEMRRVGFGYNAHPVVEDITFTIGQGDYLWVIGPNGSGKTTLMKLALGILEPKGGDILLLGRPVETFRRWERVAYVPQTVSRFDPFFPASAMEVAAMGLLSEKTFPRRLSSRDKKRVERAFEQVGIAGIMKQRIGELSGGQVQRVYLARALVSTPDIIFLDEPTSAVEPGVREEFFRVIDELNRNGTAVFLINHDIAGMGIKNNKILFINRTQLFFGNGEEFCVSPSMGEYFGSSQHIICHQHAEDC